MRRIDRRVGVATPGQVIHLAQKGLAPGKGAGIKQLQENVGSLTLLAVQAAESTQAVRQHLDHQRQTKTLVPVFTPAQR